MRRFVLLTLSHLLAVAAGFALGVYTLPILIAPPAPTAAELTEMSEADAYTAQFRRDLAGSDRLHWGEGTVSVGREHITFVGRLAPGPDYKLYLSPQFVETKADFERLRARMVRVGDVRTFENFIVRVPDGIDPSDYNAVIVWCEAFSQFITAAQYR